MKKTKLDKKLQKKTEGTDKSLTKFIKTEQSQTKFKVERREKISIQNEQKNKSFYSKKSDKFVKKINKKNTKNKDNFKHKNGSLVDKKFTKKQKFFLIFSGSIIGFLNGFFGGGGGMICVPILQKVLSLDAKKSHATAIMVIFPLSLISAFIYVINGFISSLPLLTIGLGVVSGGIVGSFALKFLPPKAIRIIFAIVMFVGGIKLIL